MIRLNGFVNDNRLKELFWKIIIRALELNWQVFENLFDFMVEVIQCSVFLKVARKLFSLFRKIERKIIVKVYLRYKNFNVFEGRL